MGTTVDKYVEQIVADIQATAKQYNIDAAEVATWHMEDAKKERANALRLVTIRKRKLTRQERTFTRTHEEHPNLEPRARGIQKAALDARREQFAEAVKRLAAAAHVLVDTERACGIIGGR